MKTRTLLELRISKIIINSRRDSNTVQVLLVCTTVSTVFYYLKNTTLDRTVIRTIIQLLYRAGNIQRATTHGREESITLFNDKNTLMDII